MEIGYEHETNSKLFKVTDNGIVVVSKDFYFLLSVRRFWRRFYERRSWRGRDRRDVDLDWSTIRGEGTLYKGQVAEIAPDNLITASYAFGLFAYYYVPDDANTPPFEVVNY